MRFFLLATACLALVGCVEVTRFSDADGDIYLADCDTSPRLESCRAALDSTCPQGYDLIGPAVRHEGTRTAASQSPYFRCR